MTSRELWALSGACALGLGAVTAAVVLGGDIPREVELLRRASDADLLGRAAGPIDKSTRHEAVGPVAAVVALMLLVRGRARLAVLLAVAVAGAIVGNTALKHAIGRPRPELLSPLADVSKYSFPSGHAAATAALALAVVMTAAGTRWLVPTAIAATVVVALAALAQLELARHYPSDLVAGWLWAGAWTTAVWATGHPDRGAFASGSASS